MAKYAVRSSMTMMYTMTEAYAGCGYYFAYSHPESSKV